MHGTVHDSRRAARRPTYEIHEILPGHPRLDLGVRAVTWDFLDAVDEAMAFIEEHDPERRGEVGGLDIVCEGEIVWRYEHSQAAGTPTDLVGRWGFDVTRSWTGPSRAA